MKSMPCRNTTGSTAQRTELKAIDLKSWRHTSSLNARHARPCTSPTSLSDLVKFDAGGYSRAAEVIQSALSIGSSA